MQALQQKWVLACVDGSALSDAVVDYAGWIAEKVGSPLDLVHVIEHSLLLEHTNGSGNLTPNMREHLMQTLTEDEQAESKRLIEVGKALLTQAQQRLEHRTITEVTTKQRHGQVGETLTDLADEIRVLVLNTKGKNAGNDDAVSSHLEDIIRTLHRPILLVSGAFEQPKSLMLAYNDTLGAQKALEMVCKSPLYQGLEIHLVHVSDDQNKGHALLNQAANTLKNAGLNVQLECLTGDAQTQLLAYQDRHAIDMTLMGAFNHGKLRSLFFGSFTLKMLQHNRKPILLIR